MRDIALTMMLVVLVPMAFRWPWIGAMVWTWVSLMYPQRLTFGFAHDMPIAAIVGGATLLGFVLMPADRRLPRGAIPATLALFILWMCVTSIFAIYPSEIGEMFVKVMKIQLMTFVTMALLHERRQIDTFVWVIALSLGFYGVKGGLFTLRGGGVGSVEGPPGSFIAPNNELGLALTMVVPLMYYLFTVSRRRVIRLGLVGAMILTAMSVLGTHSRGALLAILAMALFLWLKNPAKLRNGIILVVLGTALVAFMPQTWVSRMQTIETYQTDSSAEGRLNAWAMSWHLALDRPIGGGFEVITPELFARYAPDPSNLHAAHSIYFQVLGEHGFPGLFLFLLLWFLAWRTASRAKALATTRDDMAWATRLALMVQVSLVAYLVGGAFLSLAYFDLPYDLLIILVVLRSIVNERVLGTAAKAADATASGPLLSPGAAPTSALGPHRVQP
jgi:probable O-glycosylation ligase (exosortase A-associated)